MAKESWSAKLKREKAELEAKVEELLQDAALKQDNNVYDKAEQKFIKIYQWGFYILLAINILQLIF